MLLGIKRFFGQLNPPKLGLAIIALNVLAFFVFRLLYPDYMGLFMVSAESNEHPISLLLANFNHGGLFHLFMNMLFVYIFAESFDRLYSKTEQVLLYLFSGVLISALMYALLYSMNHPHLNVGIVGFSGVCFFMLGSIWMRISNAAQRSLGIQLVAFHVLVIALGANVAWYGHAIGFMTGYVYYYIRWGYLPRNKRKPTTLL